MRSRKYALANIKKYLFGYSLIAPALVVLIIFFVWPLILGLQMSFNSGLGLRARFVGMQNYVATLTDPRFWNSLRVSIVFTVSIVFFSGLFGLLMAIALVKKPRFYILYITSVFMPYITTPVIGALVWFNLLSDPYGLINTLISNLGGHTVGWLKHPTTALISLIFIQVWYTMGYNAVLFMSGLQVIPNSYFEAAEMEGCSFLQKLIHVTLPLLIPSIVFVSTLSTLYGFINSYVLAKMVTGGGPFEATNVMMLYIFEYAFDRFDLGRANAITMITLLLFMGIAFIQFNYQKRKFVGLY